MMNTLTFAARVFFVYLVLSVASFLMLRTIMGYMSFRDDVQFLIFKQAYIHNTLWKTAFYIHVFSAILALCAGFTQFSQQLLRDSKALHRFMGKLYVTDIVIVNFPAGLIMALYANGGIAGRTAFLLLDILWFAFTWQAYACAKDKDFTRHKHYMIRSYALTFSAITLRTWKFILSNAFSIDLRELYIIDAWLGFLPNMLVAELIIHRRRFYLPNIAKLAKMLAADSATTLRTKSAVKPTSFF
jgi:uncharacterized membrane protein